MFKHTISYTDYNGTERNETFYFNFSKAELMERELSTTAGIEQKLRMMIATGDNETIVKTFKNLILDSYGIKSEDGKRFIKSKELRDKFEQSEAYSELFIDMLANKDDIQTKFINGVIAGKAVPTMDENEAIAKLKELGYDTTMLEKNRSEKTNTPAEVVEMSKSSKSDS